MIVNYIYSVYFDHNYDYIHRDNINRKKIPEHKIIFKIINRERMLLKITNLRYSAFLIY